MTRGERREIWERYLTDDNVIEAVFMGSSDLLSEDPAGLVFVHCKKKGGKSVETPISEREFDVLFNFDKDTEMTKITELWLLDGDYEEYLHEYLEEYKEFYGEKLEGFYVIDIFKNGEFIWNYINGKLGGLDVNREERKNMWERILETSKPLNIVFIGSNDLLSEDPSGNIYVEVEKMPGLRFSEELRDAYFKLRNFDSYNEVYKVDVYHCESFEYDESVEEYISEINEVKEYGLPGMDDMFYIKIVEDGEFTWNYLKCPKRI